MLLTDILKYILISFLCIIALFIIIFIINIIVMLAKGYKLPKRKRKSEYKKRNILVKFFYDLPKAKARDFFNETLIVCHITACIWYAVRRVREKPLQQSILQECGYSSIRL